MPTRTIVQDLCDVCFAEQDGREVPAEDRLRFGWQGRDYLLLVCEKHVDPIRNELQRLSELATPDTPGRRQSAVSRPSPAAAGAGEHAPTLFSQLTDEEKQRFRVWADMPTARRIGDSRVQQWIDAGRP